MGWTSTDLHGRSVTEYFKNSWRGDGIILDSSVVHRTEYYSAVYLPKLNEIIMVCALLRFSKGAYGFSYKDMTEHSGPGMYDCPKNIFKALTPLQDKEDTAKRWRNDQLKKYLLPSIHTGDTLIIKDWTEDIYSAYECIDAKRNYYRDIINHKSYRMSHIKNRNIFTILNNKGEEKPMLTLEEFYRSDKFIHFTNLYTLFHDVTLAEFLEKIEQYNKVQSSARGVLGGVYQIKNKEDYVCCIDTKITHGKKTYLYVELSAEDIITIKKQHIKNCLTVQ